MPFFRDLFDTRDFPARWHCGTWSSGHGWLHIVSDVAIWGAYMAIPCALLFFILRRRDAPFPRVFWLFGAFIFACGTGHLLEAVIFWHPVYRAAGVLKAITALVSWGTVVVLIPLIPRALGIPTIEQVNRELEAEVSERRRIEDRLRAVNTDLECFHDLAVGREERMIALKVRINELRERLGEPPEFDLDFGELEAEGTP
ncbi:MAG: hypothetical protein KDC38_05615 [Planctomycetes bacterium]|nr:hypothetical protein [Planctomycetota bacterium]